MIIQKVLKGISGLKPADADTVLQEGILCNWLRKAASKSITVPLSEHKLVLTADNLDQHVNRYKSSILPGHHLLKVGGTTFGEVTPFISTTAGAIQQRNKKKKNILFDPFVTALNFATNTLRGDGCIFYGYVFILGKEAVEMQQFSEEIRELHIYRDYMPYHKQGEITAKIHISSVQLEKYEYFDGPQYQKNKSKSISYYPTSKINPDYKDPIFISNIREVLS
ncbi:MAG: hypothetical protein ABW007_13530 [Chitinophagaceae bacterium]